MEAGGKQRAGCWLKAGFQSLIEMNKTLFSLGIFGKPTTLNMLLLLEEFEDRPEAGEGNNAKNYR